MSALLTKSTYYQFLVFCQSPSSLYVLKGTNLARGVCISLFMSVLLVFREVLTKALLHLRCTAQSVLVCMYLFGKCLKPLCWPGNGHSSSSSLWQVCVGDLQGLQLHHMVLLDWKQGQGLGHKKCWTWFEVIINSIIIALSFLPNFR